MSCYAFASVTRHDVHAPAVGRKGFCCGKPVNKGRPQTEDGGKNGGGKHAGRGPAEIKKVVVLDASVHEMCTVDVQLSDKF